MAEKKYVQTTITIPNGSKYSRDEKLAIAKEVLDYIRDRTANNRDKDEKKFKGYSKDYIKSLDFKVAGKSKSDINLRLSGDMMAALEVLSIQGNKIKLGFDPSTPEADRAEGNIRGTYGKSRGSTAKARNFLGIKPEILKSIVNRKFPLSDDQTREENTDKNLTLIKESGEVDVG